MPLQLRQEVAGAYDGTRHELREETQVEREVEQIAAKRHLPPVYVNQITYGLKREERDADGQHERVQERQVAEQAGFRAARHGRQPFIDEAVQEIGVFEVRQQ